jgi:protein involved in polysaccharide export with SLBB domain
MKLFKKTVVAAALSLIAGASFAMTPMQDESLAQVSGQDGVSIGADLNINVGSFVYTDTDADGGSFTASNIAFTGMIVATIDILNHTAFANDVAASMMEQGLTLAEAQTNLGLLVTNGVYDNTSDVVRIAIPDAQQDARLTPSFSVASMTMGNSTGSPSFGSIAMNNIDMQGTKVWIWAH